MRAMSKTVAWALFWAVEAAGHAACLAGSWTGGWLLGLCSDCALLIAEFDVACAAVAILACLVRRRRPGRSTAALALLAVAMPAFCMVAPWAAADRALPGDARPSPGPALLLLQGNTQGKGNPFGFDFDVAVLSELWGGPIASPPSMPLVAGGVAGSSDAAVYSRLPVLASGRVGSPVDGWTQGAWARLAWRGRPITVVSIHAFSPRTPERARRRGAFLAELASFVQALPEGEPVILSGDWNSTPTDRAFMEFMASGSYAQEPDFWSPTWHAAIARFGMGYRIDRTLGSHGARVRSWRALPPSSRDASDHLFSVSELDFAAMPRAAR